VLAKTAVVGLVLSTRVPPDMAIQYLGTINGRRLRQCPHITDQWPQSTHRVATSVFWSTFHHGGKISPGWEVHAHTISQYIYLHVQGCNARFSLEGRYALIHIYPYVHAHSVSLTTVNSFEKTYRDGPQINRVKKGVKLRSSREAQVCFWILTGKKLSLKNMEPFLGKKRH